MPGGRKKQTVGYKYYLGEQMALCHGPVDRLSRIRIDKRDAWCGKSTGGRITIDKEDLFGGDSREGGVSGAVDIEFGAPAQGQNDYLVDRLGSQISAYRGVVCAVLRQVYLGMSPYLKPWEFRLQRIHTRQDGLAQWYDEKAGIFRNISTCVDAVNLCLILDASGSMLDIVTGDLTRWDFQSDEIVNALNSVRGVTNGLKIGLVIFGSSAGYSATFRQIDSAADLDALIDIVTNFVVVPGFGTDWEQGMLGAQAFFNWAGAGERVAVFTTDGQPTRDGSTAQQVTDDAVAVRDGIESIAVHMVNIDLPSTAYSDQLDNTGAGASLAQSDASGTVFDIVTSATTDVIERDMNPAHIVRECLTDPDWGLAYPEADIDDAAFATSADALFEEGMGMSLVWDRAIPLEDFISEVLRHIDAVLYVDRETGLFVLQLIRGDYDAADLLLLDEFSAAKVERFKRPSLGELVNSISLTYWDAITSEDASIGATDLAMVQLQGSVIADSVNYPGFTHAHVAARVLSRDLRNRSTPLATCVVLANRSASTLHVGSPFKLTWADLDLTDAVMRVVKIDYGSATDARVRIECVEDIFNLPAGIVSTPANAWSDPTAAPAACPYRIALEAPYYELVQHSGTDAVDSDLAAFPELGYLVAAGSRPSEDAIQYRLMVDAGSGYQEVAAAGEFAPIALLVSDCDYLTTTLPIANAVDIDLVEIGTHVQMGSELCRVDAVSDTSITLGRGVLDTVPVAHAAGTLLLFWGDFAASDQTEYAVGESVSVKLLPVTGLGVLPLGDAPADTVPMNQRAIRPYAPGAVTVNTAAYPETISGLDPLSVGWSHRDRLQQTADLLIDTSAGDVGPETGTGYTLRLYGEADDLQRTVTDLTGKTYTWDTEAEDSGLGSYPDPYWSDVVLKCDFNGEGAASFEDQSGRHLITGFGGVAINTTEKKYGAGSVYFDGVDDYLLTDSSSDFALGLGDFTVEFWLYFIGGTGRVTTRNSASEPGSWSFTIRATEYQFHEVITAGPGLTIAEAIPTNVWTHFAATREAGTLRIFRDGVLKGSTAFNVDLSQVSDLLIGRSAKDEPNYWNAYLDDLRITKGVARYTTAFTPPAEELPDLIGRVNGLIRFELESVRDGYTSYQHHNITVRREGYGFNYGYYYGGT